MPYGNNRFGTHPAAHITQAGGSRIIYRHPYLAGHVSADNTIDYIDVSKALKLNETFFAANPAMQASVMDVLVDGSAIILTNTVAAGTISLSVVEQGGFVGAGDFLEALKLVSLSGDSTGGTISTIRSFNGTLRVMTYYGVTAASLPVEIIAGNSVPTYAVQLNYAGWYSGIAGGNSGLKYLWAVGNTTSTAKSYSPLQENEADKTEPNANAVVYQYVTDNGTRADTDTGTTEQQILDNASATGLGGSTAPSQIHVNGATE